MPLRDLYSPNVPVGLQKLCPFATLAGREIVSPGVRAKVVGCVRGSRMHLLPGGETETKIPFTPLLMLFFWGFSGFRGGTLVLGVLGVRVVEVEVWVEAGIWWDWPSLRDCREG